jgi:hypothetical protein
MVPIDELHIECSDGALVLVDPAVAQSRNKRPSGAVVIEAGAPARPDDLSDDSDLCPHPMG